MHVWVSVVHYMWSKSTFLQKIEKFRKFPIFSRITRFASPSGPGAIHASKPSKITKITDLVSSQMDLSVRSIFDNKKVNHGIRFGSVGWVHHRAYGEKVKIHGL